MDFISVQTPVPEEGYHFFVANKKNTREFKTKFLKQSTREEVLQYRRDHVKVKEGVLINRRLTQTQNLLKKGSKAYFMEKMVNSSIEILGDSYNVVDIYYHKGKTDSIRIHGSYYARISIQNNQNKKQDKKQNKKAINDMKSYIQLSYSEKVGEETHYWTHVFHVLEKMKEIGTLEPAGLLTNYNHYFTQPIVEAKRLISAFSNKDITLKRPQVSWIIGRHLRDNKDGLYIATSLSETNTGKINGVMVSKVNPDTMLREAGSQEINANVIVAMTLAIEYHENKLPSYAIDTKYDSQQRETKYKMYDFIIFDANYFKDFGQKSQFSRYWNCLAELRQVR